MNKNISLYEGKKVEFDSSKNFMYIKSLGRGGTGDVHLFEDEFTNIKFAIKKYSPKDVARKEDYYIRFVNEMKILFQIQHKNIVRIYNYYLYPSMHMGYIQMEYVDGNPINEIIPEKINKTYNELFEELIDAFSYLEENKILHRDIRPSNFLITSKGELKIIDFGFGKQLDDNLDKIKDNSILLNWPVTINPKEVKDEKTYNENTEIYYLGNMLKNIINKETFKYNDILSKMIEYDPKNRYKSFFEIKNDINKNLYSNINFSDSEKEIYIKFADCLTSSISKFTDKPLIFSNEEIISKLKKYLKSQSLENIIQSNSELIQCFTNSNFIYYNKQNINTSIVQKFLEFLLTQTQDRRDIIFDNLKIRLFNIKVEFDFSSNDLPF